MSGLSPVGEITLQPGQARMGPGRAVCSFLLSLVAPGLGQVHARAWHLGVLLFAVSTAVLIALRGLTRLAPSPPVFWTLIALAVLYLLLLNLGTAVDALLRTRRTRRSGAVRWFRSTWFAAIVVVATNFVVGAILPLHWRTFSIPSGSNIPTLLVGDDLVADLNQGARLPSRGDMVVFRLPRNPGIDYIKRVVGLPGDHVQMKQGRLVLNGRTLERSPAGELVVGTEGFTARLQRYTETLPEGRSYSIVKMGDNGPLDNTQEFVVPAEAIFTIGDNRDNSLDSRSIGSVGFIPVGNIIGRAAIIYWAQDKARIGAPIE